TGRAFNCSPLICRSLAAAGCRLAAGIVAAPAVIPSFGEFGGLGGSAAGLWPPAAAWRGRWDGLARLGGA
ncbi:hypothetical protein ACNQ1H_29245, partial [Enterobacter cloacae complex sp.6722787]|uniref:hypothetical protein n=1 Tax=Enterobacter cloacae complex sp.6722787 TaxID=3397174 RepID=UPI003AACB6A2